MVASRKANDFSSDSERFARNASLRLFRVDVNKNESSNSQERMIIIRGPLENCVLACREIYRIMYDDAKNKNKTKYAPPTGHRHSSALSLAVKSSLKYSPITISSAASLAKAETSSTPSRMKQKPSQFTSLLCTRQCPPPRRLASRCPASMN